MDHGELKKLVLVWGVQFISSDFNEDHMNEDISLLGLDSIAVVEFCEYLNNKIGLEVDYEWVMGFETLNHLIDQVRL